LGDPTASSSTALDSEQQHLDLLYRLLDRERARVQGLKEAALFENDGTPSGLFTRDALQFRYAEQLAAYSAAEDKLCFGRLDMEDDGADGVHSIHIGRLGLADDSANREQVLVGWRAPYAAPFYTATALDPRGVLRRRHIRTAARRVTSLSDEYLQAPEGGLPDVDESTIDLGVGGDGALLEALSAPRTGRMGDIIETIQAEQDAIIRSDRSGVLVVQGGPGTGKTVVALHRAAYLLYTYRQRLGSHGVLVIGPSRTFLQYIGQVLPSLGETSVVLATIGTLLPGVTATGVDTPRAAALKGSLRMTKILDHAVLDRQRIPNRTLRIGYDRGTVTLDPDLLRRARERAWSSRRPHNKARAVFLRAVLTGLAEQVAQRPGVASLDPDAVAPDLAEIVADLSRDTTVQAALATIWPLITAEQLIRELLSDPERLAFAAPALSAEERQSLLRDPDAPLTVADIPLIDEAWELVGDISESDRARQAALAEELQYASDTLEALGAEDAGYSDSGISFTLSMLTPQDIARLHDTSGPVGSTAERASADRAWTYGHVVVDEAQELSPMAWRAVFRRCPLGSMTIVGDTAQTSDAAGTSSWARVLAPHAKDRWRLAELTVNYRTPAEIMQLAAPVLAAIDPALSVPSSVRESGDKPWLLEVAGAAALPRAVAEAALGELREMRAGQLAVLYHDGHDQMQSVTGTEIFAAIRDLIPDAQDEAGPDRRVVVLPVREAKGLEFDRVLLVEPAEIAAGERGLGDLYVAMTRATQRLGMVHARPLPGVIDRSLLRPRD
jgi:DNA helicase IV